MIICLLSDNKQKNLSSGDHLMTVWWSSVIWQQTNTQTIKQKKLVNICSLFDDILLFIWQQTNKLTNKAYHLLIICDHLLIIWRLSIDNITTNTETNKQTNRDYHLLIICDHLLIIWWLFIDNMTTNKWTNKQSLSSSDHLLIL